MLVNLQSGIGRAISIALAKSSANVALLDLSIEAQEDTKIACQQYGVRVASFKCDITDIGSVRDCFIDIAKTLGPVDILVNNAGVADGKLAAEEDFEGFWKAVEVNFKGTMLCIYEVLQIMRRRKSGCIINLASRAATVDMPRGLSYNSSKAAVVRSTATLQEEFEHEGLGQQIHTYCLHPGGVWGAMAIGAYQAEATRIHEVEVILTYNVNHQQIFHRNNTNISDLFSKTFQSFVLIPLHSLQVDGRKSCAATTLIAAMTLNESVAWDTILSRLTSCTNLRSNFRRGMKMSLKGLPQGTIDRLAQSLMQSPSRPVFAGQVLQLLVIEPSY